MEEFPKDEAPRQQQEEDVSEDKLKDDTDFGLLECFGIKKTKKEGSPRDSDHCQERKEDVSDSKAVGDEDSKLLCLPVSDPPPNPEARMMMEDSENYNMSHEYRGIAAVFVHENFTNELPTRSSAEEDYRSCKKAFKNLGYEVRKFWDLKEDCFLRELEKLASENHSDRDSLVVVVMSHGGVINGREFVNVYDGEVDTCVIWSAFTEDKSPTLAGKPKLLFIQACRGRETDQGIKLRSLQGGSRTTDPLPEVQEPGYVIPVPRDFLIMWASYPGMYAFKSFRNGIRGSVFIHFLKEEFGGADKGEELFPLLLRVTWKVAIEYESSAEGIPSRDKKKQAPYMTSTLRRRVFFK